MLLLVLRVEQLQLGHQLATVTDTEAQRVLAGVEALDRRFSCLIEEDTGSPSLSGAQYVGVRESTAEDDQVHVVECLAARSQVGQVNIFHVEACQIHRVCHLTLAVGTLVAEDRRLDTARLATVGREAIIGQLAGEVLVELELQRLHLIVLEAIAGADTAALLDVQLIGGRVPDITHIVDAEVVLDALFRYEDVALAGRFGDLGETYARVHHQFLEGFLVLHLNDDTRVLGEEDLHDVALVDLVEVHLKTALHVREAHLQQGSDHTAGRDIVTSQDQALLDGLLNGVERVAEVFRILDGRNLVAQLVERLRESGAAQLQRVEREVDIIDV